MTLDERLRSIAEVLAWVAGALGIGFGARRILSKDARDRAKDSAEQDYFSTHASELIIDRDNWRRTAEEAWAKQKLTEDDLNAQKTDIAILGFRLQSCRSQLKLQRKLIKLYPGIESELDSGPMLLDDHEDDGELPGPTL